MSVYDLILLNADVITMDPAIPRARCVVVRDGRIVEASYAGLSVSVRDGINAIDLGGRTVLPGFIDAHCHIGAFAESLVTLDLSPRSGVDSIRTVQERVGGFCEGRAPGTWVRGRGYDEFRLAEQRHPSRWDIDAVAPDHPVKLTHRSGHAHVLNSLALKLAGITIESGDPPGGMIDRALGTGEPTGLLFGMGGYLAHKIPHIGEDEIERGLSTVNERLLSRGITSVQDATAHNGPDQWKCFERWKEGEALKPRVTMMMGLQGFHEWRKKAFTTGTAGDRLRLGAVKIVVDEVTGVLHPTQEELNRLVLEIHRSGLQVAIHAIEENVIEAACIAIGRALAAIPRPDHRHRIEHCSVCPPALAGRLGDLGIAVCTQPVFLYESGDRYLKTVPTGQQQYLYPVSTIARSGLLVAFGSDAPIATPDPFAGVRAAVDRTSMGGETVVAEEGIDPIEALRMHTVDAAKAAFEEELKGSVTPGKMADFVVLNADPCALGSGRIEDVEVDMTIIGGEIVWERRSP